MRLLNLKLPKPKANADFTAEVVHCPACHNRFLDRPDVLSPCPACGAAQPQPRAIVEQGGRRERQP